MRLLKALSIVGLLLTLSACASLSEDQTADWSAQAFYQNARDALNDGDYEGAIELYTKLEARYPYGRYAQQAQLETAYAHYKANEPSSAIAAAERFIKLNPRHPNVDYAYYLRGLTAFSQGSSFLDKFLPQDKSERDPAALRESFNYFKELINRFPNSRYAQDAIERMVYLRNSLARHEVHAAAYYLKRGIYLAAAKRGKYVLENYQQANAIPDALVIMVKAYREMQMEDLANDALRILKRNYPEHSELAILSNDGV